ncbi:S-layer homology domain-containing protein [Paenibacillus sp. MMS20-IR301]|uniref:S-layer homology domain-containing protein n=1 Tax=Paenibacillus sp. MMS20-IR301 TaxID=2895946 RepID=UPI0028E42972|nr:S-layer homology domain-containing protein [Paenibacillus sp. MMS20-IR301]WNS46422.1 S-layer homology domain-containing protein [Paenibacillus sp. MMS20-IR301]
MRGIKQAIAVLLVMLLAFGSPVSALAGEAGKADTTVLSNGLVKITVNNATGRFAIRTIDGQPVRKKDQNINMMFKGDDPETSFTTFRIDGTDYIFGNPYKFAANFLSEISAPQIVQNTDGTKQIETVWTIKGIQIKQIIKLYMNTADAMNAGNVNVSYLVVNNTKSSVEVGSRILLDTMVGSNDGPAFQVGKVYKTPLQVERKLVDEDKLPSGIGEDEKSLYTLPAYWVMKDKYDSTDHLATNAVAYGFNNFSENDINIVDEMIVGHWSKMANTKWDYEVNPNLDFTTNTNDYGSADSAVALYWNPDAIPAGATHSYETVYGLGEIVQPDKVFSIRYIDPVNQLATLEDNSGYEDEGVFDITAEVENLEAFNTEQSSINVSLQLDNALKFVDVDTNGRIKRDANGKIMTRNGNSQNAIFRKEATPAEAEQGIQPKFKPGETVTASFKVIATGRAWPTTPEYLLSVSSPETEAKVESIEDETVKAQYKSSKANFVLLPPVGTATPTYVYAMSPEEAYTSDVKYITLNLSNIEAYNTGNGTTAPNFDLYFKEVATGNRYKVPVKDSVILQPANDGQVGDMRITYRTGDLVDKDGNILKDDDGKEQKDLGPDLPLGEYETEIDYKDTADTAGLYDLTTSQRFVVSDNEEARIKKAGILAVVKRTFDLSAPYDSSNKSDLEEAYAEAFPGYTLPGQVEYAELKTAFATAMNAMVLSAKVTDPEFGGEYLGQAEEIPAYHLEAFESEEDLEEFKESLAEEDSGTGSAEETEAPGDEVLLEIRGMINQIGSGDDAEYVVDTKSEPAIINNAVAYEGKDMVFASGKLDVLSIKQAIDTDSTPLFDTLGIKGDGTLSVAGSGFVFFEGEWTLDFFNGFSKSLTQPEGDEDDGGDEGAGDEEEQQKQEDQNGGAEDDSLNGALTWASGAIGERLNPLRQLMIPDVYFNRQSLFAAPSFSVNGFDMKFNDYILRPEGISFSGDINLKLLDSEIKNVLFNEKGFVGIDTTLKFDLNEDIGLIAKSEEGDEEEGDKPSGEITIVHYVQDTGGVPNTYGLKFNANVSSVGVSVELAFKQVADKRILPDVIGFEAELGDPGVLITGATYLTGIRGAIRELADTIAGEGDVPLTLEAGADITFGVKPATFYGSIDMTLKKSGIKLVGKMDYQASPDSERLAMLTEAKIAAQWMTPWFVSASATVDVLGWDVIIGKASLFVGENLIKNRIDFEGFVGAKLQVPSSVPLVGGMPLAGVSLGVNNDKMWGSVAILFISLGVTYYFDGDIEFGTSGEKLPDGLLYLQVQDPETGPKLMVFGQGAEAVATSWVTKENMQHEIEYHSVADGVSLLDNGTLDVGIGGIKVADNGKLHEIPMSAVSGNAILEVQYYGKSVPELVLKDNNSRDYKIVYDELKINDPNANAFTQEIAGQNETVRKAYIAIPASRAGSGTWKLYADQNVDTRLFNIPEVSKLDDVRLDQSSGDTNAFTASWKVSGAKPDDTINLYLTKDAVLPPVAADGSITAPGDAGVLIAKDLKVDQGGGTSGGVTSGSIRIDATQVSLLGATEDIRGLMAQGDYYLRAELHSSTTFGTKTSADKFKLIDPLAPAEATEVAVKPAGNGYFALSFKPAAKKPGQKDYEHSYSIEVLQQQNGQLAEYESFSSLLFTEEELQPYWNEQSGKYEGIRLGGWTLTSKTSQVDQTSLEGNTIDDESLKYKGLKVGEKYVVGVSAAVKPDKVADKNENLHYAERADTANTLLPIPSKLVLSVQGSGSTVIGTATAAYAELLSSSKKQTIKVSSSQQNVEVEAIYDGKSLGTAELAGGSAGTLDFSTFTTDGTYAVELRTRNKTTGDFTITMLYLTVDTIDPVLYIDTLPGTRTAGGKIRVTGQTSNDAALKVNGQPVTVGLDGRFDGEVTVTGSQPTLDLAFEAVDRAGNSNSASVVLTNGGYQVPVGLVLRKVANLGVKDERQLEAFLRVPDGKDAGGKVQYKEVPVAGSDLAKLTYSLYTGEAAEVSEDGRVKGLAEGSAIVSADYKLTDSTSLQGMTVINVVTEIKAYTSAITGNAASTKVNVLEAGDTEDAKLVYKVYPADSGTLAAPRYKDDVSGWGVLPENGVIPAVSGDRIALAKLPDGAKQALAVSALIPAVLWSGSGSNSGGGNGGGAGGGSSAGGAESGSDSGVYVGGSAIQAEKQDNRLLARISGDTDASVKTLRIEGKDTVVSGYEFAMDRKLLAQAAERGQGISIVLPFAELSFPSAAAATTGGDLKILIDKNSSSRKTELAQIAKTLNSTLLGGGEGVTFDIQEAGIYKNRSVAAKVALPETIAARDITAVVLRDSTGSWTTVPWSLDVISNKVYVDLTLTGNGSIGFISKHPAFTDVSDTHWAKLTIQDAAGKLFMQGRAEDRFEPDSRITRAEYPAVLLRVLGLMNQQEQAPFTDVKAGSWYSRTISIAVKNGLVTGLADGTFHPNEEISRLSAMVIAGRAVQLLGQSGQITKAEADAVLAKFKDGEAIPEWARATVALSIKQNLISGQNGFLLPDGALTRAQAAAIAIRLNTIQRAGR